MASAAVRIDPFRRVKGMGGNLAGRIRCAREGKEDMCSAGVGEDGGRGDRAQQGSMVTVVVVRIVRFQRGEGVRVRETRDWWGRDCSRKKS